MFNPLRWFYRTFCTKNTSQLQFESLRIFMRHLGYPSYTEGRFIGDGMPGSSSINYRTAVRLHNEETWLNSDGGWTAPKFNPKMRIRANKQRDAMRHRVLHKCKQQLVERYGEQQIKTQSHVVHFADRGYAKAAGLL